MKIEADKFDEKTLNNAESYTFKILNKKVTKSLSKINDLYETLDFDWDSDSFG